MPPPGPYGPQSPPPFGQNPYMGNPYAAPPPMQPGYVPQPGYIPQQNFSNQARTLFFLNLNFFCVLFN